MSYSIKVPNEDYFKKIEEEIYQPRSTFSEFLRYIEKPVDNFSLLKFLDNNLFIVSKFLKQSFEIMKAEGDRGFLEGEVQEYSTPEILYLFSETLNTAKKINKIHARNVGEDPLGNLVDRVNKLSQVNTALNDKKVDEKLFNWFAHQYKNCSNNFDDVCDFVSDGFVRLYEISRDFFGSISTYLQTIYIDEAKLEGSEFFRSTENISQDSKYKDYSKEEREPTDELWIEVSFESCPNTTFAEYNQHLKVLGNMARYSSNDDISSFLE